MKKELVNDIIQWDVSNWSRLLSLWQPIIESEEHKTVLALGEREGGLSLWMGLNHKNVVCSDLIINQKTPFKLHVKYNITDNVKYKEEDATNLSYDNKTFDIVIFKSIIGNFKSKNNQAIALNEAYRVLKPGGYLLFAENLKATKVHQFAREKFTNWGKEWTYPTLKEFEDNCSSFNSFKYEVQGVLAAFGRSEKQRSILAKIDRFLKPITPKSWKYILFGTIRK